MGHYFAAIPVAVMVALYVYNPQAVTVMAWSAKLRFLENVYNIYRETSSYEQFLEDFQFNYTVELGCGYGLMARYIRPRTKYLVGVDIDKESLEWAAKKRLYDRLIQTDIRRYEFPEGTDSVFIVEVLEHLERKDGEVLEKLRGIPFVWIVTPVQFHGCSHLAKFTGNEYQKHRSRWTEADFEQRGYRTFKVTYRGLRRLNSFLLNHELLAIKYDEKAPNYWV